MPMFFTIERYAMLFIMLFFFHLPGAIFINIIAIINIITINTISVQNLLQILSFQI
jgi:hypothetical protein